MLSAQALALPVARGLEQPVALVGGVQGLV
jgi:hypothetical protein